MTGQRHGRGNRRTPWLAGGSVALIAAFASALSTDMGSPPRFDGAGYAVLAEALSTGIGYREVDHPDAPRHAHFPPGYPGTLALLWSTVGRSARSAHLFSVACNTAAAVAAWAWFRRNYGGRVGDLMGLAVAVNWSWQRTGGSIQSEPLFCLLSGLSFLVAAVAGRRGGVAAGLGLGALLGAAVLTRHVGVALALAVGLDLLFRRKTSTAIAAGLTCALLVGPWAFWLSSVKENTQAGLLSADGLPGRIATQAVFYAQRLPDALTGPFVEVATVFRPHGPIRFAANGWAAVGSGLILAGWLKTLKAPGRRLAGLASLLTLSLLLVWPFTEAGRFLTPMAPWLVVGATEGLGIALRRLGFRRPRRWGAALVLAASLPYSLYSLAGDRAAAGRRTHADFDAGCAWLAREADRPGPVLTRHPGEVYWLSRRHALSPKGTEDVAELADRYGVAYLLLDNDRYANAPVGPLDAFVRDRPERLREVWRRGDGGRSVVILELLPIASSPRQRDGPSKVNLP